MSAKRARIDKKSSESDANAVAYDFYQFVGEDDDFTCYRIDTALPAARALRKEIAAVRKCDTGSMLNFFWTLTNWFSDHEFEEDLEELLPAICTKIRALIPEPVVEKVCFSGTAPLRFRCKIANLYILPLT